MLAAICALESERDPKCYSTACRFENFIYGTRLNAAAREEKIELQKELIRGIWRAAADRAAAAGASAVAERDVREVVAEYVRTTTTDDGATVARFKDVGPVNISPVRSRQMASIAYSLRAILSVEQDALFGNQCAKLPLDVSGIEALRAAVDTVTLCALQVADQEARRFSEPVVSADRLRMAWRGLVPKVSDASLPMSPTASAPATSDQPSSEKPREQLLAMIDGKLSSYRIYNETTPARIQLRFLKNVNDYYALYMTPKYDVWINRLMAAYGDEMTRFATSLLAKAEESARESGRLLIRSPDATAAVGAILPHEVDDFEDVTFFLRLPENSITIESYDCDSYRDTGFHWQFFKEAITGNNQGLLPDPFAAEILTEAISDYGVLLFRIAGRVAGERQDAPALRPAHLNEAGHRITTLAIQHHDVPERPDSKAASIVSATGSGPPVSTGTYFTDVTESANLEFRHDSAEWLHAFRRDSVGSYPTFSGGGIAAEDIDGDGHVDLLFVGGGGNSLYLGDGDAGFHRAEANTEFMFADADGTHGEARQPLIIDFDNDGRQDVLVSYANDKHRLYHNVGKGRFADVTERAGLGGEGLVGGPATAFDFDNDGLLDLYITYFGDYLHGASPLEERNNTNALANRLFRNLGRMTFADVTENSGTDNTGWCQAVSHTDFDRDGRQDIIVANDFGRNALLKNLGGGKFADVSRELGHTKSYHSMNVGVTDLNRDGFPDIYISNIATMVKDNKYVFPDVNTPQKLDLSALSNMLVKEANVLYVSNVNGGRLTGYTPSADIERGESSTGWAWDAEFLDFDNDGDDDLYVTNGTNDYNVFSRVVSLGGSTSGEQKHIQLNNRREANVFYVNEGGRLTNRSLKSGADFAGNSRSTAYLDWDADGDLDIAVNNFHSRAVMLQNNSQRLGNHWIKISLIGDPAQRTNRDAIGARIVATNQDGLYLVREVQGGSGYLSQNPKEQHFGLGDSKYVDVTIHWPAGEVQRLERLAANRRYVIRQGEDAKGF